MRRASVIAGVLLVAAVFTIGTLWTLATRRRSAGRSVAQFASLLSFRPVEGRLASALLRRPFQAAADPLRLFPRPALDVAQELQQRSQSGNLADQVATGESALMLGDTNSALTHFNDALDRESQAAAAWCDLSVLYLMRGSAETPGDARWLTRSIDAALESLARDPAPPEPWFNLALGLQRLGVPLAAEQAWQHSLERERDPAWRAEIASRLAEIRQLAAVDDWPARRARLLEAGTRPSEALLAEAARGEHQRTRVLLEEELLPRWAAQGLRGDDLPGSEWARRATILSRTLSTSTGDDLLLQEVQQIERADARERRILADAHVVYGRGRANYEATQREQAAADFQRAATLFEQASSPFALRARLHQGISELQFGRTREALAVLDAIRSRIHNRRFPSLDGGNEWTRGIALTRMGRADEALDAYRAAARLLDRAGEQEDLVAVASSAANSLRVTGEHANGWTFLSTAMNRLTQVQSARRRHTVLLNASLFAADDNLNRAALALQEESLRAAYDRGAASTIVEGLVRRARLHYKLGDARSAGGDLSDASQKVSGIASDSLRAYVQGWLDLVRGESSIARDPAAAVQALANARASFERSEPSEVPGVYLAKGQALLAAGNDREAERSFSDGVAVFTTRWSLLAGHESRASYLNVAWQLFSELIRLSAITYHNPSAALAYAERARAIWISRESAHTAVPEERAVPDRFPPGATVVYYSVLDDRVLIWLFAGRVRRFEQQLISAESLNRRVEEYRRVVMANAAAEPSADSTQLFELLLSKIYASVPAGDVLVIVPDATLHLLPFAGLRNSQTNRLLIEEHAVVIAPSLSAFVDASRRMASQPLEPLSLLAVGSAQAAGLSALPFVGREIDNVASLYALKTVLVNQEATFDRTRQALPAARILHFAGHARANETFPWRSALFFQPDDDNATGTVTADALDGMPLAGLRLVVLSACETADGPVLHGQGVVSLASAFLARGVPSVIGSLWRVDDRAAAWLVTRFHEEYVRTRDPVRSLQTAQLAMLHAQDHELAAIRNWSAFVVTSGLRH